MLRNSERQTQKACEFRWQLSYDQQIEPDSHMPALRLGTLIHKGMAGWYIPGIKRGVHPAIGFEKAYEADLKKQSKMGARDEDGKWNDAGELGVAMLNHYVDVYGKDERWEVLVTEYPFKALVYKPGTEGQHYKKPEPWFWFTGVLDGVWRDRQSKRKTADLWIPDHKSTAGIGDSKLNYLQLDDQAGGYWSYGVEALYTNGLLKKGQRLSGMLYNFLRKAVPDERPYKIERGKQLYLNKDGSVSKQQPSPYFLRAPIWRDEYDRNQAKLRIQNDFRRNEMLRSGELEVSKNPGMFTCPGCWASDICELHETGADYESMIEGTTQKWEPYAEHEIYQGR